MEGTDGDRSESGVDREALREDLPQQIRDSGANSDVVLEGIIMTMADSRTNLSTMVINDVREYFPEVTYETIIPRNIRLGEAPSYGKSIIDYAPSSTGAAAYRALAEEFLRRHA